MLSREELRLLNKMISFLEIEDEDNDAKKLQTKLGLLCEQLDIMEKAQKDAALIQDKIAALDGGNDEKKED